jgi:hypothetical protein
MDPTWLSPTVTGLAEAIYRDRAFDRMPILADALEDAGCDQGDILGHCRRSGERTGLLGGGPDLGEGVTLLPT